MLGNLLIQAKDPQDFEAFAKFIFALLNVEVKGTRYSENSPGGRYVYGESLGLRIKLVEANDSEFPDYDFHLNFRPQVDWGTADLHSLDGLADAVAKYLAGAGMKIVRPLDFGKIGTARAEYGN